MKKNNTYEIIIEDLNHEGQGTVTVEGFPVLVENALPGERVVIKITKVLNKFAYGRVMEFITESEDRVPVTDKVGTWVGTMPLQHMSYDLQLKLKKRIVRENLEKHFDISNITIEDTLGMEDPWHYRNKAQVPVKMINGQLETGLYKRGTHDLIPMDNYHIQEKNIDAAIMNIRNLARNYKIVPYDEESHTGTLRHIIVRYGHYTDEMMVVLVTTDTNLPKELVNDIKNELPHLVSIVQNINDKKTNAILGREKIVLFGEDIYHDKLLEKTFKISSQSFYQVNTKQTEVLYSKAIEYTQLTGNESVIDAYCGIGTITLNLADKAKHVYGVEIVEDAITMAKENANLNNISNVTFVANKAEDQMKQWVDEGLEIDVIVVDPPRKGLDESFIRGSLETRPKSIVYVSCNPVTLGRDLKLYVDAGYTVEKVQPVDMFPQTSHIENVVQLKHQNVKELKEQ